MRISAATPNKSFTVLCQLLGSAMHFDHEVEPMPNGVRVLHRVRFNGWLAGLLLRTVGADVATGLPVTMLRLKALCEGHPSL